MIQVGPAATVERTRVTDIAAVPEVIREWLAQRGEIGVYATLAGGGDQLRAAMASYLILWDDMPKDVREAAQRAGARRSVEGYVMSGDGALFAQSLEANQAYRQDTARRWNEMTGRNRGRAKVQELQLLARDLGLDPRLTDALARGLQASIPELEEATESAVTLGLGPQGLQAPHQRR